MCPSTRAPWARWTLPWRPPRWWWRPWERRCQAAARQPRLYKRRWIKTYVLHIPFGGYCAYFMVIFGDCVLSDLPCLQHFLMKSLSKKVWHGESWVLLCFTLKWPFGSRSCFDPVSNTPTNYLVFFVSEKQRYTVGTHSHKPKNAGLLGNVFGLMGCCWI